MSAVILIVECPRNFCGSFEFIDGNYSTLWVASLDGTNRNDNNAWIRLDFRWYPTLP